MSTSWWKNMCANILACKWFRHVHNNTVAVKALPWRIVRMIPSLPNAVVQVQARSGKFPRILLSCDGGGIRGLASVSFLAKLEEHYGICLAQDVDLFVGTSTGSFIVALIGGLGWTARDIQRMYITCSHHIMPAPHVTDMIANLWRPRFGMQKRNFLRKTIAKCTGSPQFQLRHCLRHVIVTAYAIDPGHNGFVLFDSKDPHVSFVPLYQALDASSAAPVYFPTATVDGMGNIGANGRRCGNFVDGAMVLNNPSIVALQHIIKEKYSRSVRWSVGELEDSDDDVDLHAAGRSPISGGPLEPNDLNSRDTHSNKSSSSSGSGRHTRHIADLARCNSILHANSMNRNAPHSTSSDGSGSKLSACHSTGDCCRKYHSILLSVGTGNDAPIIRPDVAFFNAISLLNFVAETSTHERMVDEICKAMPSVHHIRINGELVENACMDIANLSESNLNALIQSGEAWFDQNRQYLDSVFAPISDATDESR